MQIANALEKQFGSRFPDDVLQEIETIGEVTAAVQEYLGTDINLLLPEVLDAIESSQTPRSNNGDRVIPESHYVIEKTPEYIRFARLRRMMVESGIRNPFFSVHEGRIADTTIVDGRELISFSSYNYVGLSGDPEVNQSAIDAITQYGTSVSASRIVSGEKTIHKILNESSPSFLVAKM